MVRYALLTVLLGALVVLAVRRWFAALCGLVLLTVLTQHPSMPSRMLDIQGINPWNAVFAVVVVSWWLQRGREPELPRASGALVGIFVGYTIMVVLAGLVAAFDVASYALSSNVGWIIIDGIINPLKYLAVGYLAYDGVRSRQRLWMLLVVAVASGIAYAALLYKTMTWRVFTIDFEDARRMTDKLVGLYANDLAKLLAFACWAVICIAIVLRHPAMRATCLAAAVALLPVFVALKSRAGFLAFAAIGLVLGALRWRWVLVGVPVVSAVLLAIPSVQQRVLTGVDDQMDWDAVSAGRMTNLWPPVLDQIGHSPVVGHGRFAILREDCREEIIAREGVVPSHPHNAYLEVLLDAGVIGLGIVLALLAVIGYQAVWMLRRSPDRLVVGLGSVALAGLVAEMSTGIAGSSFFPTQSSVPVLCVWGAALRVFAVCTTPAAAPLRRPMPLRGDLAEVPAVAP